MHNVLEITVGSILVVCVWQVAHTSIFSGCFFEIYFFFILPLFRARVSGITFSMSVALQVWCYSRQSDKYPARWCYLFLVLSYSLVGLSAAAVFCFLPLVLKLLPSIGQMLSNTETHAYFF